MKGRVYLIVFLVPILYAADETSWTWVDREKHHHSHAELVAIVHAHGDRNRADLSGAAFTGREHGFSGANLKGIVLKSALLHYADLRGAFLEEADFSEAALNHADLTRADLTNAKLTGAVLWKANLTGANLTGVDLSAVALVGATLKGTIYEPKENPSPSQFATTVGLGYLTWSENPGPIFAARKSLLDSGFREQARQITAAIHRHDQNDIERILFDWTCEWGANVLRPLALVAGLCLLCTVLYWVGMHFGKSSGLYLAATGERITTSKGKERVFRIARRQLHPEPYSRQLQFEFMSNLRFNGPPRTRLRRMRRWVRWEFRALSTAFLFSLMSAFNIGFREFNFGRWIRMLQPREFDVRARGWIRTVSGIQSLLGVALVALALLSYFGHPFD